MKRPGGFADRNAAGEELAELVADAGLEVGLVAALPRGGVPVAYPVARRLERPLDLALVGKVGAPHQPELALGAVGEGGITLIDEHLCRGIGVGEESLERSIAAARAELDRRAGAWRGLRSSDAPTGGVLVVDDGVATGSTAVAAARVLEARGAEHVFLAIPVAPEGARERLEHAFDRVISLRWPLRLGAVGSWYADFSATSEREVERLLRLSASLD